MSDQANIIPVSVQFKATVLGRECHVIINASSGEEARRQLLDFCDPKNIQPTHDEKGERTVIANAAAKGEADNKARNDKSVAETAAAEKASREADAAAKAEAEQAKREQEEADRAAAEQAEQAAAAGQPEDDAAAPVVSRDEVLAGAKSLLSAKRSKELKDLLAHPAIAVQSISTATDDQLALIAPAVQYLLDGNTGGVAAVDATMSADEDSGDSML